MAELTLTLEVDPVTGKKNITIDLKSDPDALPMEHEEQHKALVNKLLEEDDVGKITISRPGGKNVVITPESPKKEKTAVGNKS
jgi:hypothetical protein